MSVLSQFGIDLTELARTRNSHTFYAVGERHTDIDWILSYFASTRFHMMVVVGPPGVGKTAIVRHVANLVALGQRSAFVDRIIEVDSLALYRRAGTTDRFCQWIIEIADEVSRTSGDTVVFLDNIDILFDHGETSCGTLAISAIRRHASRFIAAMRNDAWDRLESNSSIHIQRLWQNFIHPLDPESTADLLSKFMPEFVLRHRVLMGGITHYKGFDLRVLPPMNDVSGMPREGKNLIVFASVSKEFHIQIFDSDGKKVVNADEKHLTDVMRGKTELQRVEELKKQLEGLWPPHDLTRNDKDRLIDSLVSIFGHPIIIDPCRELAVHCVDLASRLLTDSSLPGSAIYLMEKAMNDASPSPATGLRNLRSFVEHLEDDVATSQRRLRELPNDPYYASSPESLKSLQESYKNHLAELDSWIARFQAVIQGETGSGFELDSSRDDAAVFDRLSIMRAANSMAAASRSSASSSP